MCGRYPQHTRPKVLAQMFNAKLTHGVENQPARYNIAPTTPALVIRMADVGRVIELMRWGLIPHWSQEPTLRYATFNARSEEAASKASYRGPMRYRRCLVPVDGFYEWVKVDGQGTKQPYLIRMADERPFVLGGLWDCWRDELQSFTILTTQANEMMARLHHRMPVIVGQEDHERWLNQNIHDPQAVADICRPYPSELMFATAVSDYVNNARNDGPECLRPVA